MMISLDDNSLSLFVSRRKSVICLQCNCSIQEGDFLLAEDEKKRGFCRRCAAIDNLTLLSPGDVAMTRRSKKHSSRTVVLQKWNNRRKRYERQGQYVEAAAISLARRECEADKEKRAEKNRKAAEKREIEELVYLKAFEKAIRIMFPSMPVGREALIAKHACEKYSGRVGRSANAKEFDPEMITRAVIAHIRHHETEYDNMFGKGQRKKEIRSTIRPDIQKKLNNWKRSRLLNSD